MGNHLDHGRGRRLLLASIHDVGPRFESEVDRLADRLEQLLGGPRFAMLVVPNHWGEAPLVQAPHFAARLRCWADRGVEMFLHGFLHRDDSVHTGLAAVKARRMTAGEGEFLGLSAAEAARRLRDGRAIVEDAIGRPVAGFIAPAWLYGPGAHQALTEQAFPMAEDHVRVWRPADGAILARGPVITWASRSTARQWSSRAFAGLARATLRPMEVARIGVHPGDAHVPALLASIDATVRTFLTNRSPGRYAALDGRARPLERAA